MFKAEGRLGITDETEVLWMKKNWNWNKVELRKKNKNLPPYGENVCWAMEYATSDGIGFNKFFGILSIDGYVDTGINRYKLTSKFWWIDIPDPEVEEK